MENAVESASLGKVYGRVPAVRDLNLTIPCGEVFGLLGPNGAGKTTTIMMLLGNIRPTSGQATLLGKPIGDVPTRRRVGYLPEKFQFHDFLTAVEFLRLQGRLMGMSRVTLRTRIPTVLAQVDLTDAAHRRIRTYSRGMQQRIGLAQAILAEPDLVILDEPTSALDPIGRRLVRDLVMELRTQGKTVILNSHLLSEIEMTCDRMAILNKGRVVTQGTMQELLSFSSIVEIEVEGMNDAALQQVRQLVAKLKIERMPLTKFTAWVRSEADIPELAKALVENGVSLRALIPRRETLEELFVRIIESDSEAPPSASS